jgi:Zn-dependent peptidase ImmA (M78 family)
MEHVLAVIEDLRSQHEVLREDRTPIDVFTFLEIDLGLNPIPFDDLKARYDVEAAIMADFTGIYLDAEQYILMEHGPEWRLKRLRFTVAHELGHYFLHRHLPQTEQFASLPNFARWTSTLGGNKYTIEQEANEFAGRLLVPKGKLQDCFDEFAKDAEKLIPHFMDSGEIRRKFAEQVAPRFGVNSEVVEIRIDRDGIWPAG